jgi:hypothetical protein
MFEGRKVLTYSIFSFLCLVPFEANLYPCSVMVPTKKKWQLYSKLTVWQQLTAEYVAEYCKYPVLLETLRKPYFSDGEFPEKIRVHFTCCPLPCYR